MRRRRQDDESQRMQRNVSYLLDRLGTPLVSYIAGADDKMAAWIWAEPGVGPTSAQASRVNCAYETWKLIQRHRNDERSKQWFTSHHPHLGVSPAEAIREGDFDAVRTAARQSADLDLIEHAKRGDPVVIYDAMRGAANRCAAVYLARITGDPDEHAIAQARAIGAFARGIDTHDAVAQLRAAELLSQLYDQVVAGEDSDLTEVLRLPDGTE